MIGNEARRLQRPGDDRYRLAAHAEHLGQKLVGQRELVLLQVKVDRTTRAEVIELCDIFRAKIIDVSKELLTIEITGDSGKVDKFIALMDNFGLPELTRTGKIALPRVQ